MLNDAVLLEDLVENAQRTPGVAHVILRNNLEPIHNGFFTQDVAVMRHTQANADAVSGLVVESIRGHGVTGALVDPSRGETTREGTRSGAPVFGDRGSAVDSLVYL